MELALFSHLFNVGSREWKVGLSNRRVADVRVIYASIESTVMTAPSPTHVNVRLIDTRVRTALTVLYAPLEIGEQRGVQSFPS